MDNTSAPVFIELLKQQVSSRFAVPLRRSSDFSRLSEAIKKAGAGYLSVSTLKRLWGYVKDTPSKHLSTLDILARFVGFDDFNAFCLYYSSTSGEVESGYSTGESLDASTMTAGDKISVSWQPDRLMKLECTGPMTFRVIEAINTKLAADSTVRCMRFIEGKPLMLDIVCEPPGETMVYVVGNNNGISFRLLSES